jgi:hypothetical protein
MRSCWTGELACARVCCTAAGLLEKSEMARWLTKCPGDKNNQQRNRAVDCIVLDRPRNLRLRAISLFGLSPPCQPGMAQCLTMDSCPAEPPCSCAALTSAARTPYHQSNPFESQTRTWMRGGPAETPLYGWSWPSTTKHLGRMIGQAQRPRYVVIVFLYCCTPLSCPLSRHAHLRRNLHYSPHHIHDLRFFFVPHRPRAGTTTQSPL